MNTILSELCYNIDTSREWSVDMTTCVPIKDMRNTVAFTELVETSPAPITVTKNGYDLFVVMTTEQYAQLLETEARNKLLERILIAERERAAHDCRDAREHLAEMRARHGL